jgi:hypothetical protein
MQGTQSLARKVRRLECHAGDVAARPGETANETTHHRIAAVQEHDRDRRGGGLCLTHRLKKRGGKYHVHSAFDESGCVCGKLRKSNGKLKIDR